MRNNHAFSVELKNNDTSLVRMMTVQLISAGLEHTLLMHLQRPLHVASGAVATILRTTVKFRFTQRSFIDWISHHLYAHVTPLASRVSVQQIIKISSMM